jgi:hypothetical protein
VSADSRTVRTARRLVAVFWVFTALYIILSVALLLTQGVFSLIFIAILAYSWFFQGWPDTKPHFVVLREAHLKKASLSSS